MEPFAEGDIETLEDFLFDPQWADEALDFFGLHGILCASLVGPKPLPVDLVFSLATGQDPGEGIQAPAPFATACGRLENTLRRSLEQGQDLELPEPEDGDPRNALENWCAGFVDALLMFESDWFEREEEWVAGHLLPIMAFSRIYDDEDPDFRRIREDEKLGNSLLSQIPESLTDLYLFFHAP